MFPSIKPLDSLVTTPVALKDRPAPELETIAPLLASEPLRSRVAPPFVSLRPAARLSLPAKVRKSP